MESCMFLCAHVVAVIIFVACVCVYVLWVRAGRRAGGRAGGGGGGGGACG